MCSCANFRTVFSETQNANPLDAELEPDFVADSVGLSSFNFFVVGSEKHVCNATECIIAVQGLFRVNQGR